MGNANSPNFRSKVFSTDFEAPTPTPVFNNAQSINGPEDTIAVSLHAREFDLQFSFSTGEPVSDEPVITNSGFDENGTYFIEFTPGGLDYKMTTLSGDLLDFASGTTDVVASQPNPNRFKFEATGASGFYRVEK